MLRYAYVRVSKQDMNLERQIDGILEKYPDMEPEHFYYDKKSGKDLARKAYQSLRAKLQEGDELIIHTLDRLGRNKQEIKDELEHFKHKGVIVRCFDIPTTMVELSGPARMMQETINNIIIEVLAYVAQQERERISTRTKEGLAAKKKRGVTLGRPQVNADKINEALRLYVDTAMSVEDICIQCKIAKGTFYKYLNSEEYSHLKRSNLETKLLVSKQRQANLLREAREREEIARREQEKIEEIQALLDIESAHSNITE